jgi:hypothetical protein
MNKKTRIEHVRFRVGDGSRGHFTTISLHTIEAGTESESVGVVSRSRTGFCRPVPSPNRHDSQNVAIAVC